MRAVLGEFRWAHCPSSRLAAGGRRRSRRECREPLHSRAEAPSVRRCGAKNIGTVGFRSCGKVGPSDLLTFHAAVSYDQRLRPPLPGQRQVYDSSHLSAYPVLLITIGRGLAPTWPSFASCDCHGRATDHPLSDLYECWRAVERFDAASRYKEISKCCDMRK